MSIAVIAGLGNPGAEYARTRHNLGFWLVDALARDSGAVFRDEKRFQSAVARIETSGRTLWLFKPLTFMNESGSAVAPFLHFHKLPATALAVVHDDITLPLGRMKISVRGSAGGHNGIESIIAHLGEDFARVKLGIGSKAHPEMNLADHVLSRLTGEEETTLAARQPDFLAGLRVLIAEGSAAAMNKINGIKN
ncbi:MAG TPA: aminoacyl-tRNA hydrolase [Opitutales bacterium]|jgi:PTH1 family peptidyl-tRNA hydrolase|nr:aminoacyl-tRNA hydrolase [Opitutales bacterium]